MLPLLLTLLWCAAFSVQSTGGSVASGYAPAYTRGHRYYPGPDYLNCRCLPYETCVPVAGGMGYACTAVNSGSVGRGPLHYLRQRPVHGPRFFGNHHGHRARHYGRKGRKNENEKEGLKRGSESQG